jgi:serine phosphatase RsbU (regulator of sigma subunit)
VIRAILVDDEPPARARLRALLTELGGVRVVGEAGDAEEARTTIAAHRPDVVFLDIEMPETPGTALAASLPEPRPFIVFATAFDRFALEAYQYDATDYLLKPINRARLAQTLARVRERLSRQSDLERELRDATEVQSHLLPRELPCVPGFDCAALSRSARGVGGDFYDLVPASPGRMAVVLGDVSGKGTAAGLVASSIHARLHTAARHASEDPPALVAGLNHDVYRTTDGARYASLIFAGIDTAGGQLRAVNAGHPPALIVRRDGAIDTLAATGPALGLLPEARFEAHDTRLDPGDSLILYSDGVTEALDESDTEFGDVRLVDMVRSLAGSSAAACCRAVVDAVGDHRRSRQRQDDVTVLVVRRMIS